MDLKSLLRGVDRAPWSSAGRQMLLRAGFDLAHGLPKTIQAILAQPEDPQKAALLTDALVEHLVAGEKAIQLVKITAAERNLLQQWINSKRLYSNDLTAAFPGVAEDNVVVQFNNQPISSVGSAVLECGTAAIYTAARSYVKPVAVSPSQLKPGAGSDFERIVGYRRVFRQTYEAIWLPPVGRFVCIAVDFPRAAPKDFSTASASALHYVLRKTLNRPLEFANFWPAVDGLYQAPDGKLVDYGFSVAGQSVNHHKARRRSECLRQAVYDAAGASAVKAKGDDLELFKVAMRWKLKHPDGVTVDPEVIVPGVAADLNKPKPLVDRVILRDCLTSRDLDFVVSKLAPHIK